jgi:hypothetical protein
MTLSAEQTARLFLNARQAFMEAEKAKKEAETELRKALASVGVNEVVVDGQSVQVVDVLTVTYDADKLAQVVKPTVFRKVTKAVVDKELMKSALAVGLIDQLTADEVSTVKPSSQVRVYALSPDAKKSQVANTTTSKKSA